VLAVAVLLHLAKLQDGVWWKESVTARVATVALRGLKPVVPERFGAYFPA
jgi:membrane protein required for colicin V production